MSRKNGVAKCQFEEYDYAYVPQKQAQQGFPTKFCLTTIGGELSGIHREGGSIGGGELVCE